MTQVIENIKSVLSGQQWRNTNKILKSRKSAIPAVCVRDSSSANAALAAAAQANSPIIILTSFGGGQFSAGKSLENTANTWAMGAQSIAQHVHLMAPEYGVTVILATDHCHMQNLPWMDAMLKIDSEHCRKNGNSLWSGHMLDLSASKTEESLPIYKDYLKQHDDLGMLMEFEIGETGGEEDGVQGTAHYTSPEECSQFFGELISISSLFSAALTFGNVHGVYKGEFDLRPDILGACQAQVMKDFGSVHNLEGPNPMDLVFHGGSGCTAEQMKQALEFGTVKQNIDTDTQWAFTCGVRNHIIDSMPRLSTQVGYAEDPAAPNKKFYDPRGYLFKAEQSMTARILESYDYLNGMNLHG